MILVKPSWNMMLILCHNKPKLGWFTDTAASCSRSIAAFCMTGLVLSVSSPIGRFSKEEEW